MIGAEMASGFFTRDALRNESPGEAGAAGALVMVGIPAGVAAAVSPPAARAVATNRAGSAPAVVEPSNGA